MENVLAPLTMRETPVIVCINGAVTRIKGNSGAGMRTNLGVMIGTFATGSENVLPSDHLQILCLAWASFSGNTWTRPGKSTTFMIQTVLDFTSLRMILDNVCGWHGIGKKMGLTLKSALATHWRTGNTGNGIRCNPSNCSHSSHRVVHTINALSLIKFF